MKSTKTSTILLLFTILSAALSIQARECYNANGDRIDCATGRLVHPPIGDISAFVPVKQTACEHGYPPETCKICRARKDDENRRNPQDASPYQIPRH